MIEKRNDSSCVTIVWKVRETIGKRHLVIFSLTGYNQGILRPKHPGWWNKAEGDPQHVIFALYVYYVDHRNQDSLKLLAQLVVDLSPIWWSTNSIIKLSLVKLHLGSVLYAKWKVRCKERMKLYRKEKVALIMHCSCWLNDLYVRNKI